jgi:hypothetical protein
MTFVPSILYFSFKESKQAFQLTILGSGKEVTDMSTFEDAKVISTYTLQQAIEDGVLVEIFKNRWKELSSGKPIVATDHIFNEISLAGLLEIWNEFVNWRKKLCRHYRKKTGSFRQK